MLPPPKIIDLAAEQVHEMMQQWIFPQCVAPVGSISTYSSCPITAPLFTIPVASATFFPVDCSIPTTTSDPGYIYTPTYLPTAPNTLTDCAEYRDYDNTTFANSCSYVAFAFHVTTDQLMDWNPSLSTNVSTCALQPGYSYCVVQSDDSTITGDGSSICLPINATESTTVSNCNCFTQIWGYLSDDYSCADIATDVEITETELLAWNPWLAGDCDTELYANLDTSESRAVCIGIDTSATTTTSSTSAAPTSTDTVAGCQEF
ncbi:hypothetical protein CNMCM5793_005311 [Aspergillus hiratsukae]|uniref:LysM domain-containing protein n=1 Tax=Aspergillus hiratsukae TaxID=1194566 RepID=A0A8H6P4U9_9EURO|nr:hypothetical protein CNMCM5793_005311 [Aspergillus hiratsukae]KAF7157216.1 hypothetical protein CNMCM6106_002461 [Aspergillus hiratsukae]